LKTTLSFLFAVLCLNLSANCQVSVNDSFNNYENGQPQFEITKIDEKLSNISYLNSSDGTWTEEFYFNAENTLVTTAPLDKIQKSILMEEFIMVDDEQLTFETLNCSVEEKSLIYFFIMEWFLFG
tara:strand:- start:8055 stop:8429 length:375 start_codon:yes stop_codon:yes gene_type:complete